MATVEVRKVSFWEREVLANGVVIGRIECSKSERPIYTATDYNGDVIGHYKTWKAATQAITNL